MLREIICYLEPETEVNSISLNHFQQEKQHPTFRDMSDDVQYK